MGNKVFSMSRQVQRRKYGLRYSLLPIKCMPSMIGLSDEALNDCLPIGFQLTNGHAKPRPETEDEQLKWDQEQHDWEDAQRKKCFGCVRAVAEAIVQWYPKATVGVEYGEGFGPFRIYIVSYGPSQMNKDIYNSDYNPMDAT